MEYEIIGKTPSGHYVTGGALNSDTALSIKNEMSNFNPRIYQVVETRTDVTDALVAEAARRMPVGDLPGWKQILAEDFTRPVPVGGFVADQKGILLPAGVEGYAAYGPGRSSGNEMRLYPDGWSTTHGNALYGPNKILSVIDAPDANGVLNIRHQTAVPRGGTVAKPLGVAAWFPLPEYAGSFHIGPHIRMSLRMQSYGWNKGKPTNYHAVPLFISPNTPTVKTNWPHKGEIDYPEGDAAADAPITGWYHRADPNGSQEQIKDTSGAVMGDWHIYTVEWRPDSVKFFLDDRLIKTATTMVPQQALAFILQFETTNVTPDPATVGNVRVDWLTLYKLAA